MAILELSDEIFARLTRRAEMESIPPDKLIDRLLHEPALDLIGDVRPIQGEARWHSDFDALMNYVASVSRPLPPEFSVADDRESIYEGRGE